MNTGICFKKVKGVILNLLKGGPVEKRWAVIILSVVDNFLNNVRVTVFLIRQAMASLSGAKNKVVCYDFKTSPVSKMSLQFRQALLTIGHILN